ncbi:ribosome-associated protein [Methylobacillus rhizosphaerae]|uniref:Dual-action ribosomal maturation protein DarP n=1 Tax=Methylobacillus rhizosphaerae TaxID=551994 RepID=A0A239B2U4_9PROT|nr:ribosome biogenesis factor YjgA [Methylobacillus rhizosphaerae]SNS02296.1 ribosome-associated protein [Methylobacillus rhizosphaerae]
MKPNKTENTELDIEPISKTRRKAEADAVQAIGVTLVGLPKDKLAKLDLPEALQDAVNEAKRITSNGALRRQMQYLGRLMRDIDTTPIVDQLQRWEGTHHEENARFHRLEQWRTRLIADESSLAEFIKEYPHTEVQQIRNLIRNARREQDAAKPPKSSRELFKLLRSITENLTTETELNTD